MTPTLSQILVVRGGFGLARAEFGAGLVVARLGSPDSHAWSGFSAVGTAELSWGALLGAQISDHVFVCMADEAVQMRMSSNRSVQSSANAGVGIGPIGRAVEAYCGASPNHITPTYTYSLSKGLYAGVSHGGKVIVQGTM
jgi:SH3 domain-containing YSC84-like protein 1